MSKGARLNEQDQRNNSKIQSCKKIIMPKKGG
jgi:hypothetical protein